MYACVGVRIYNNNNNNNKSLFQAMPIKVRCKIDQTSAQIFGARVHVRIITKLRTHIDVAKEAYICKYKHLNQ